MRRLLGILGAALLAGSLAAAAVFAYRVWDPFAGARQHAAQHRLYQQWSAPPGRAHGVARLSCRPAGRPAIGQVFAIIQIPAFGPHWKFTVIQGTSLAQLATGPGHIPGTALPGRPGNAGIAAHDITAGNPFLHLAGLRPGDRIIITTRGCRITYRVNRAPYRVWYTDTGVLRPAGRRHLLTLITCWPTGVLYFVPHRTIVQAVQVASMPR